MSQSLDRSLEQLHTKLATDRGKLSKLDIPKLDDALKKLGKLLTFSKKTKGNDEAIRQLIDLVECLNQSILIPIVEARANTTFSISEGQRGNLSTLFSTLDDAIPAESQSSRFILFFSRVDVARVVADANSKIGGVLNTFLKQQPSGDYLLIQNTPDSGSDLASIPQPTESHVHDQEGSDDTVCEDKLSSKVQATGDQGSRVRILLLGKSGAGKSSLIRRFGVSTVEVANYKVGSAEIDDEHTSASNPHVVFHDSMGFETGNEKQCETVKNFIKVRGESAEKLHAIWLCTPVPVTGCRAFETGDEEIFRMELGDVPLIVVFTQYDTLVSKARMEEKDESDPDLVYKADASAEAEFIELCVRPLEDICTNTRIPESKMEECKTRGLT